MIVRDKSPRCISTLESDPTKVSAESRPTEWLLRLEFGFLLTIQLAMLVGAILFVAS